MRLLVKRSRVGETFFDCCLLSRWWYVFGLFENFYYCANNCNSPNYSDDIANYPANHISHVHNKRS